MRILPVFTRLNQSYRQSYSENVCFNGRVRTNGRTTDKLHFPLCHLFRALI
jgi:hypothetical protein